MLSNHITGYQNICSNLLWQPLYSTLSACAGVLVYTSIDGVRNTL